MEKLSLFSVCFADVPNVYAAPFVRPSPEETGLLYLEGINSYLFPSYVASGQSTRQKNAAIVIPSSRAFFT